MPKRYYDCPIIGSGTPEDPYRAKVEDHVRGLSNSAFVAHIPCYPLGHEKQGQPIETRAMALVDAADHGPLEADPDVEVIAEVSDLDKDIASLSPTKRQRIGRVTARRAGVTQGKRPRDTIRNIGRKSQPTFDERYFDANSG